MTLEAINKWLRMIGLVLVVAVADCSTDRPIVLWIERAKAYDARTRKA